MMKRQRYPDDYQGELYSPGFTGEFYGRKWSFYEGAIKMPFIIQWRGHIIASQTDTIRPISMDLFPSLCSILGIEHPIRLYGSDKSKALLGTPMDVENPLISRGKWTNWDLGVHTGLIAKWPGKIKPGTSTEALVQFADVTPTFIDVAGGKEIPAVSGKSFLNVLLGEKEKHRKYVYCMHNNVPEGKPYPIRAVISGEYHYIRNLLPDSTYFEKHLEAGAHGEVWWERWKEKANSSAREKYLVERFYHRPAEEFFAVETDKEQFNNLAGNQIFERELEKHRNALDAWMKEQNDLGIPVDTENAYEKRYCGN